MDPATPPQPRPDGAAPASAGGSRQLLLAVALALVGVVLVAAARTPAPPEENRLGRRVELVELIGAEQARVDALAAKVEELTAQLTALEEAGTAGVGALRHLQNRVDALAAPAGMTAVTGPGLVVTLSDSSLKESPRGDANDLVIHEQDLQAVINALWAGGAEAMAINGQRVMATTAIRCVGNTLLLHGSPYPPPYVIAAIGDEEGLRTALQRDPAVGELRDAVKAFQLGFVVESAGELELPASSAASTMRSAQPVPGAAGTGSA